MGDVQKEIMNLDVEKSYSSKSMTNTILKQLVHIYLSFLTIPIYYFIHENTFPNELKQFEVIPLPKTLYPLKEENFIVGL